MRLLSAILLSGLFAGIAAAPAASIERTADTVAAPGEDTAPAREDGAPDPPRPAHGGPRLAATPAPVLKGPDERDRGGPRPGSGPRAAPPRPLRPFPGEAPRIHAAPLDLPADGELASDTERRAGRRPLPPPLPPRAWRR